MFGNTGKLGNGNGSSTFIQMPSGISLSISAKPVIPPKPDKNHKIDTIAQVSLRRNSETHKEERNELHLAAEAGDITKLRALLPSKKDLLESRDSRGNTPFLYAVAKGHKEACTILINAGADIAAKKKNGQNALHIAAKLGNLEIVQMFASHKNMREAQDIFGNTPLHEASGAGHVEICKTLIDTYGANTQAKNFEGHTVLHSAVAQDRMATVHYFTTYFKSSFNIHNSLLEVPDKQGFTPLLLAAFLCKQEACRLLLENGANPKALAFDKRNFFHLAFKNGRTDMVNFAVNNPYLSFKYDDDNNPLLIAAEKGYKAICEQIINIASRPFQCTDNQGRSPLHLAAQEGRTELVPLFLEFLESRDSASSSGDTPLLIASRTGHRAMCEALVKARANIRARNFSGNPLHVAAYAGQATTVGYFLQFKELQEEHGFNKETPLHTAARYGFDSICRTLLDAGSNLLALDGDGRNVLQICYDSMGSMPKHAKPKETLELFASYKSLRELPDDKGNTPLIANVLKQNEMACEILLKAGADTEATDKDGNTPLLLAALLESCGKICQLLINAKANVQARDSSGNTALGRAVSNFKDETTRVLSTNRGLLEARNKGGNTSLHLAALNGNEMACVVLLKAGADVHAVNEAGKTAFDLANESLAKASSSAPIPNDPALLPWGTRPPREIRYQLIVEMLEARMAGKKSLKEVSIPVSDHYGDLRTDGSPGQYFEACAEGNLKVLQSKPTNYSMRVTRSYQETPSPLLIAADYRQKAVCELLLKTEPDIYATDYWSRNVLHIAASAGDIEIARLFVKYNKLVIAADIYGDTPLHVAARNGHEEMCKLLLMSGAVINAKNSEGNDALALAKQKKHAKVMELLSGASALSKHAIKKPNPTTVSTAVETSTTAATRVSSSSVSSTSATLKPLSVKPVTPPITPVQSTRVISNPNDLMTAATPPVLSPSQLVNLAKFADKLSLFDEATLKAIQGHGEQLTHLFELESAVGDVDAERTEIYAHSDTKTYYEFFSRLLTGTWIACQSISSGLVQNSKKENIDYVAQGLDEIGKRVPVFSIFTGIFSGIISTWTAREKMIGVQRFALLFPDFETAISGLGKLARQMTLAQKEMILKIESQPISILNKAKGAAKDIKAAVMGEDVKGPLKQRAVEDCEKLLNAIREGKPKVNPSVEELLTVVLGTSFAHKSPTSTSTTSIVTAVSSKSPTSPMSPLSPNMEELLRKIEEERKLERLELQRMRDEMAKKEKDREAELNSLKGEISKLKEQHQTDDEEVSGSNSVQLQMSKQKVTQNTKNAFSIGSEAHHTEVNHRIQTTETHLHVHGARLEEHADAIAALTYQVNKLETHAKK